MKNKQVDYKKIQKAVSQSSKMEGLSFYNQKDFSEALLRGA